MDDAEPSPWEEIWWAQNAGVAAYEDLMKELGYATKHKSKDPLARWLKARMLFEVVHKLDKARRNPRDHHRLFMKFLRFDHNMRLHKMRLASRQPQ